MTSTVPATDRDPGGIRPIERILRPTIGASGLEVFAVEDTSAQLVWHDLPKGAMRVRVTRDGAHEFDVDLDHAGGPGAVELTDLTAGAPHTLEVRDGRGTTHHRRFRTLTPPPGEELFRFATISDLHLGRGEHGLHGRLRSHEELGESMPFLSARAAIDEAEGWGARLLVGKGDLADQTYDWVWDQMGRLFDGVNLPLELLPGNHDTGGLREFEPEDGAARLGLPMTRGVAVRDVPGLRIVLMDSCIPDTGWGTYRRHTGEVADAAAEADGGVFIATHHQPQRFTVPTYWPHGVPAFDARRFLRVVRRANPAVFGTNGHTHRCRFREVNGVPWTDVAATNHYPGVWAGYVVHEGGIRQVVRRITDPDALHWQELTRHVLQGIWSTYAVGTMSDRCRTITWP